MRHGCYDFHVVRKLLVYCFGLFLFVWENNWDKTFCVVVYAKQFHVLMMLGKRAF